MQKALLMSAENVFVRNFGVKPGEDVLLITDGHEPEIIAAFKAAAIKLHIRLEIRRIKPTGGHGREPDLETAALMKKFPVVVAPTRFSLTHTQATRDAWAQGTRVATLPGIDRKLFERGLKADPAELVKSGEEWIRRLSGTHRVTVVTGKACGLQFTIGKSFFINDNGFYQISGSCGNLPAGEVYAKPDEGSADGEIMVGGSIGGQPWSKNSRPEKLILRYGSLDSCQGKRAEKFFKLLSVHGKKGLLLAEFGIGTNPHIRMSGNLLGDEKIKGTIHIAFGNNMSMGGTNNVPIHLDCVVTRPTVLLDGTPVMDNGRWNI